MSKKVLNLVLSCHTPPYGRLADKSEQTWESIHVDGVETVFYFGRTGLQNTDKRIYLPVEESLYTMGDKLIMAFEWALANKEFDYLSRPHSCIYVDKKALFYYCQTLPEENVFASLEVTDDIPWMWGGVGFILSRDVVQKVVDNKNLLDRSVMEDKSLSYIINHLGIPYTKGWGASIDKLHTDKWQCIMYNYGESFTFENWEDIKKAKGQYFYRVKQDGQRWLDEFIMEQLFNVLNK